MKNRINEIAEDIDFIKQKLYEITFIPNTIFNHNKCIGLKNTYIKEYPSPIYNRLNPCANCPNNPMNNPFYSGFCNCILGNNIIY